MTWGLARVIGSVGLCALSMLSVGCVTPSDLPDAAVDRVTPEWIDVARGGELHVFGQGFVPEVTVDFDDPSRTRITDQSVLVTLESADASVPLLEPTWLSIGELRARVPANAPLGLYGVVVELSRGQRFTLPGTVEVLDCATYGCPGARGITECEAVAYRDLDRDGHGLSFPKHFCGPGWVPLAQECDDTDALTSPSAPERCNGIDDDCDGAIDDGACAKPSWTVRGVFTQAGALRRLATLDAHTFITAGNGIFRDGARITEHCPTDLRVLDVDPSGNVEVVGGPLLATIRAGSTDCTDVRTPSQPLVSVRWVAGTARFVGAAANGQRYEWTAGAAPQRVGSPGLMNGDEVYELGGTTPSNLFGTGAVQRGNFRGAVVWRAQADGGWAEEAIADVAGRLRVLHIPNDELGIAGGENGFVMVRAAGAWRTVPNDDLSRVTGVRVFSAGRFYVAQQSGKVRQFTAGRWRTVYERDAGLLDLSGATEDGLWTIASDGALIEGP